MSPTHHLTDETLQDYAAGSLDLPMETLVACHLTMCTMCRERAALADSVGGTLLVEEEEVEVRASAAELLARGTERPARDDAPEPAPAVDGVPRPLARLLPGDLDTLDWRRVAPGIRQFNLDDRRRRDGAFKLLHLAPGAAMIGHGHADRELTFVVRGAYTDELGRFCAGDIADLDDHDNHCPVVENGEPCIALIATQSPVRFNSILGRIMQPFVGI